MKCEETRGEASSGRPTTERRPNNSLHGRKGKTMGAVVARAFVRALLAHPWCMIMSGTSIHYSTKEKEREEGGEEKRIAIVETYLNVPLPEESMEARLWPRQVTRKKTQRRARGGFPRLPGLRIILLDLN